MVIKKVLQSHMPSQHFLTETFEAALWHRKLFPTVFFRSDVLLCTAQAPQPAPLIVPAAEDPLVPRSVLPRREIVTTPSRLEPPLRGTEWHKGGGWSFSAGITHQQETPNHQDGHLLRPCHQITFFFMR